MAPDKEKIATNALKLLQKGSLDKAVKEYEKILEFDPNDERTLQKVGDLYARMGRVQEACNAYNRVCDLYTKQGFFLKAIAVIKQIQRLTPNRIDLYQRLAEMYQQLGLVSETIQQYQFLIRLYEQQNKPTEALDALRRLTQVDTDNIPTRMHLAESYFRLGFNREGMEAYEDTLEHCRRRERLEDYLHVLERIVAHAPDDAKYGRELARVLLDHGDVKKSLARLKVVLGLDPANLDTLALLSRAFLDLGENDKAVTVLRERARLHGLRGERAKEAELYRQVLKLDSKNKDAQAALTATPLGSLAAPAGELRSFRESQANQAALRASTSGITPVVTPVAMPKPPAPAAAAAHESPNIPKLLAEAAVFSKYGLHGQGKERIEQVLALLPNHVEALKLARTIYAALGEHERASVVLLQLTALAFEKNDRNEAQRLLLEALPLQFHAKLVTGLLERLGDDPTALAAEIRQALKLPSGADEVPAPVQAADEIRAMARISDSDSKMLTIPVQDEFSLPEPTIEPPAEDTLGEIEPFDNGKTPVFGTPILLSPDEEPPEAVVEPLEAIPEAVPEAGEIEDEDEELLSLDGIEDSTTAIPVPVILHKEAPKIVEASEFLEPELEPEPEPELAPVSEPAPALAPPAAPAANAPVEAAEFLEPALELDPEPPAASAPAPAELEIGEADLVFASESEAADDAEAAAPEWDFADEVLVEEPPVAEAVPELRVPEASEHPLAPSSPELEDDLTFDMEAHDAEALGLTKLDEDLIAELPPLEISPTVAAVALDDTGFDLGLADATPTLSAPAATGGTLDDSLLSKLNTEQQAELEEAEFFFAQGLYDACIPTYSRLLEALPGHPVLLERLTACGGLPASALRAAVAPVSVATEEAPKRRIADGSIDLSSAILEDEEPKMARKAAVVDARPAEEIEAETHFNLGVAYRDMRLYNEAMAEFRGVTCGPWREDARALVGVCYLQKGAEPMALDYFMDVLTGPDFTRDTLLHIRLQLAAWAEQQTRPALALAHYRAAVALAPERTDIRERAAEVTKLVPEPERDELTDLLDSVDTSA